MTIASFIDASSGNPYDMSMELGTATVRSFDKTAHGIMLSNIAITKLAGILAGQKPDALTTSGDSGGALLNENGEVIGVLSSGLSAGEGLPLDARFVNIQDPGPGGWLSKLVGSDRLSVLGYVKGWLWDTPVQATRNAAGAADAPDDAASAQADDSDARAKAAAAAQARADAAASAR